MPTFDIETSEILVFKIENIYIFKHYFDNQSAFNELDKYYNSDEYRFEIPEGDLDIIRQILDKYYYELQIVEDLNPYCVVVEKGRDYSDILKSTVLTKERSGLLVLLLKDELSVDQAIEHGAIKLSNSEIDEAL